MIGTDDLRPMRQQTGHMVKKLAVAAPKPIPRHRALRRGGDTVIPGFWRDPIGSNEHPPHLDLQWWPILGAATPVPRISQRLRSSESARAHA